MFSTASHYPKTERDQNTRSKPLWKVVTCNQLLFNSPLLDFLFAHSRENTFVLRAALPNMSGVFCTATATSRRAPHFLVCELGISSFIASAGLGASQGEKMAISSTNNAFSNHKKMHSELDPGGARGYTPTVRAGGSRAS